MNILQIIFNSIDPYQLGKIEQHLKNNIVKKETILFQLFTEYKKAVYKNNVDDNIIKKKIYGNKSIQNSYYRLKNRLVDEINSILIEMESRNNSDELATENFIILYQIFKKKNQPKLSYYYLAKAEKTAQEKEQYSYLDLIYSELIQINKDVLMINPESLIEKRKANYGLLNEIREVDDVLSVISYRLKTTQNLGDNINVSKEIKTTLKKFIQKTNVSSSQLKIKIYKTISQILVQEKKFEELEKYLKEVYKDFHNSNIFNKKTHDLKLEMIIYFINTYSVLNKFNLALEYGEILYTELKAFNREWYHKYIYFYYQAQIANYSKINIDKAIDTINEAINHKGVMPNDMILLLNYTNLAYMYHSKEKYNLSMKTIQKIYLHDFYSKMDNTIQIKLAILELIIRIDQHDYDSFSYRFNQVQSSMKKEWKFYHGSEKHILPILDIIGNDPDYKSNKKLKKEYTKYKAMYHNEDDENINYVNWLDKYID